VRVSKKSGPVLSRLRTKVHEMFGQCRRPFVLSSAFTRLSMSRVVQKIIAINNTRSFVACLTYMSTKLPLSCEVVQKGDFGPRFVGGGNTPDFGHAFSNRSYFRACARFWLSSVQRAWRVPDDKTENRRIQNRGKTCSPTTMSGGLKTNMRNG